MIPSWPLGHRQDRRTVSISHCRTHEEEDEEEENKSTNTSCC